MPGQSNMTIKMKILCPKCRDEVKVKLAVSSAHCGMRAVASCKNGCKWSKHEQQKIDMQASDHIFLNN